MKKAKKELNVVESLLSKIKDNEEKIRKLKQSTKSNITNIFKIVKSQSDLVDLLRENCKTDLYQKLSNEIGINPNQAKTITKNYTHIANRNLIDRVMLEKVGIIEKTKTITHKKSNIVKRSRICEVAKMGSNVRDLINNDNMSEDEKDILRMMLENIKDELGN